MLCAFPQPILVSPLSKPRMATLLPCVDAFTLGRGCAGSIKSRVSRGGTAADFCDQTIDLFLDALSFAGVEFEDYPSSATAVGDICAETCSKHGVTYGSCSPPTVSSPGA